MPYVLAEVLVATNMPLHGTAPTCTAPLALQFYVKQQLCYHLRKRDFLPLGSGEEGVVTDYNFCHL